VEWEAQMPFFEELKRRNVFRVGAAYLVLAWLLIQIAVAVFPTFGAPGWVTRSIIIVLVMGFPIALILAWAFELTPEGIKPTAQVDPEDSIRPHTGQRINLLIICALSLAVVFLLVNDYVFDDVATVEASTPAADSTSAVADVTAPDTTATVAAENTIAVLPFTNLSNDADQDYFADGLTDELINKLSQVSDLQVTGRNSSFYFKGRNDALKDIGQQLGVAHLLQGSVRKSGTQLRINAQLLDVGSNANLWSQTYEAQLSDIFTVQDEIATAVTTALSITLRAGQFNDPGMTGNVEAYDAFMQGGSMISDALNGNGAFLDAIAQLEKAVALDPGFAIGWTTIAFNYLTVNLANISLQPSERAEFPARGERALEQARALAPEHPNLRLLEANLSANTADPVQWENNIKAVIDAGGSTEVGALISYSGYLWPRGRAQEALRYAERALRIDPLVFVGHWLKAIHLMNLNRLDEADAAIARGLATGQGTLNLQGLRFTLALNRGDLTTALQEIRDYPNFGPNTYALADTYANEGRDATLAMIRGLLDTGNVSAAVNSVMRALAAALDAPELALEVFQGSGVTSGDMWSPLYQNMRKLPEFKIWLRENGMVNYWRNTGNWGDFCRPLADTESDFECF
jgi:TolB-like protein